MTKSKSKVTFTYDFEKADSLVAMVAKDGQSLQQKIHNIAVCFLKYWHDNPDQGSVVTEKMNALVDAAGYHKNALGAWIQMMTPMVLSEENKKFYIPANVEKLMGKEFIKCRDTTFWEVKPPAQVKAIDFFEDVAKLVAKAQKRIETPKDGVEDHIDRDLMRAVIDAMEAAKVRRAVEEAVAA
jgi:hypothetical protein